MSILNHVPSGGLLAKPEGLKTRCELGKEEFIEKITAGLLPAQEDFVKDSSTLILGLCAGFGAGRTRACLLYTSPSPRDRTRSRMPSSA